MALILTLLLDPAAQERFDALRRAHFPADRLVVGAHVTLFHALPDEHQAQILQDVRRAAASPGFDVRIEGVRSLGRGVALVLTSPELQRLREQLASAWQQWLSPQDRQRFAPHVTVQNKVSPAAARAVLEQLQAAFAPTDVRARGIGVWRYLGGPWGPVDEVLFTDCPSTDVVAAAPAAPASRKLQP